MNFSSSSNSRIPKIMNEIIFRITTSPQSTQTANVTLSILRQQVKKAKSNLFINNTTVIKNCPIVGNIMCSRIHMEIYAS